MVENLLNFSFSNVPRIIFGIDTCHAAGKWSESFGKKILLVTGGESYTTGEISIVIEKSLSEAGLDWIRYPVSGEPSPETIDMAVETYKTKGIQLVVAIGGGSVLDAGKAIAAMFCEEGGVRHYLEGVGDRTPSGKRLPLIAIPTTSGTGSEATKNAVISEFGDQGFKKSLRHENYVPDIALIDPKLSMSCSPLQTAASGMDAFTQLMETYLSTQANPLTDSIAYSGLEAIARSIETVYYEPANLKARTDIAYAALLSGIGLANAGLGIIHGFAQPLGSLFPIPHGIVCGTLMGPVNRITVQRLFEEENNQVLEKYAKIGKLFSENHALSFEEQIHQLVKKIYLLTDSFGLPKLSQYGVQKTDIPEIIKLTGLKNHPVALSEKEMEEILAERL